MHDAIKVAPDLTLTEVVITLVLALSVILAILFNPKKPRLRNKRAQGAIEYLLIIGAAILIVAIVIFALTQVLMQGQKQVEFSEITVSSGTDDLGDKADCTSDCCAVLLRSLDCAEKFPTLCSIEEIEKCS